MHSEALLLVSRTACLVTDLGTPLLLLSAPLPACCPPSLQVFQVSDQCVKLWKEGWFQADEGEEPSGTSRLRNPAEPKDATPVIVAGKDQCELDNDYFLVPVAVKDHEGPLATRFPIENRLVVAQTPAELKALLRKLSAKPYVERLADFHLLLYLAGQAGFGDGDLAAIAHAVKQKTPLPEGYAILIDALAGL